MEDQRMPSPAKHFLWMAAIVMAGSSLSLSTGSSAQETTTTTPKSSVKSVTIDTAQVLYVSGDDAVLKMPDGSLRLFELSPGTSLTIDGKPGTAADLKPGMTLSHAKLNARTQADVTTVIEINGTILNKSGRNLTLRLEDGTAKIYRVPYHATFNVDGQETSYDNVTKGSKISATVVKTESMTTHSSMSAAVAQTPPQQGTLLIIR
jgi:hypothetical protein